MLRFLGGVCGIAISAAVFAGAGSVMSSSGFASGFAAAIFTAALMSTAAAAIAFAVPDSLARRGRPS